MRSAAVLGILEGKGMRKVLAVFLAVVMLSSLAACGGNKKAEKDCWSCGKSISETASFCEHCGVSIKSTSSSNTTTTTGNPSPTDKIFDGDYKYTYDETRKGYEVCFVGDMNAKTVSAFKTSIEGLPVLGLSTYAFSECKKLTSVTIPNGVISISDYAFADCTNLTSVTIPDSVTSIGYAVFSGCSALTSITISDGVTEIGDSMFSNCTSLTSITIPDSVTSIGSSAFWGCRSLTSITIPDSVTDIGSFALWQCNSLTSIIYEGTVAQWKEIELFHLCDGPVEEIQCSNGVVTNNIY